MNTDIMRFSEILFVVLIDILLFVTSMIYLDKRYKMNLNVKVTATKKVFMTVCVSIGFALSCMASVYLTVTDAFSFPETVMTAVIISGTVILCITDYTERKIPNNIIISLLAIRGILLVWQLVAEGFSFTLISGMLLGGVISGGVMLIASAVSKGSVGGGDIKMMAVIGFYFGIGNAFTVMLASFMLSALTGTAMIILKKAKWKDELPMAPFVCGGVIFCDALICLAA